MAVDVSRSNGASRLMIGGLALIVAGSVLVVLGCGSKMPTAKPPGSSRGIESGGSTAPDKDAGANMDASSISDADVFVLATHCVNVAAASEPGEVTLNNSVQSPADFSVTRVSVGFSPDCRNKILELVLSDGRCPNGDGHELALEFDTDAIAKQEITLGEIDVSAAHALGQINVRYKRPKPLTPSGTFGTCGGESGVITLAQVPELRRGAVYAGSYQMSLNACAGTTGAPQDLQGTFNATLASSLSDVCPQVDAGP